MIELECLVFGVGHADEGVCLLLRIGPYRVLLDCGLTDISPLLEAKTPPADLVICSHAHSDHAQGLLELHQAFPKLPIYASEVTTQLLPLTWLNTSTTEPIPPFCQALPWRTPVEFFDGLSAELYPAGHLPGAAAILLTYVPIASPETAPRPYTVFYTGDFFLSNTRLVDGLPLEELRGLQPDVLIVEGSFGTSRHPHRRQQENQLAEQLHRAIAQSKSILLPTPALGLGQELLMLLRSHHYFTGQAIDIWVNGQVATGCDAYLDILPHLPTAVQNFARHQPLFWDERVRPRVRRLTPDHWADLGKTPCIVLTDATANLKRYYQANPRQWVAMLPQEPYPYLTALQKSLPIPVETYLLAQHCDGPGTTQLIHNLRPQNVIFVHGPEPYLADLTGLDELHNRYHLHSPTSGSRVELPIGETFLQPAAPETIYEGELNELDAIVTITLPNAIAADPRWRTLSDTGLIEARWQGEELVLRGLPQRELLRQGSDRLLDWMDANSPLRNCCGNCRYFRGQRCWNAASPLFELKVTPDGFCPVFESIQTPPEEKSDQEMKG